MTNTRVTLSTVSRILAVLLLAAIAATSIVRAADVEILVNSEPIKESYTIKPGQQIEVTTLIDAGVLLKEVNIKSSNPFFQNILAHAFESGEFHRDAVMQESKSTIPLPQILPSGKSILSIEIKYDKDFIDNDLKQTIDLEVEGGSRVIWLVSKLLTEQTATELGNWIAGYKIQRANPNLTIDDLTKADLAALGITNEEYLQTIALFKEAESLRAAGKKPASDTAMAEAIRKLPIIRETSSKETAPKIGELKVKSPKAEDSLSGALNPQVTMIEKAYTVTAGDRTITKSKITVSVHSPDGEGISKVGTIAFIPKEIAAISDDLTFGQEPTIIDPDPVVKWAFKNIPQSQVKDYTFTVNKDVQNFEILAGATAERPSLMFRLIKWIIEKFG